MVVAEEGGVGEVEGGGVRGGVGAAAAAAAGGRRRRWWCFLFGGGGWGVGGVGGWITPILLSFFGAETSFHFTLFGVKLTEIHTKILHMRNVHKMWTIMCKIYGFLSLFCCKTLFCYLHCFVATFA